MPAESRVLLKPLPIDVISVQSFVAYGCVGNSIVIPALQAAGLRVAMVPTVMLSNTPHYDSMHGGAIPVEWFEGILSDLNRRGVTANVSHILTGFLGNPEQAKSLADWNVQACEINPSLKVQIDPVIGDYAQGVFVDAGLVEAYKRYLLPLAHGLVPNQFELEKLTGITLTGLADIERAARSLLGVENGGKTEWVVVTSTPPQSANEDDIGITIVTADSIEHISHRRIDCNPKGTGDLFSALLLRQLQCGNRLSDAARVASEYVVEMLRKTQAGGWEEMAFDYQALTRALTGIR